MKSSCSIIAWLFLVSTTSIIPPVIATKTEIIAHKIDSYIQNHVARKISVKIANAEHRGSGVIIARQDNTYLILTNYHVTREGDTFKIYTHDGLVHRATPVANAIETDDDLALLQFSSNKSYLVASINSATTARAEESILAVGYSAETGKLVTQEGKIKRIPDKILKDGYQLGYTSNIVQGMSGGAIFNTSGEVIGINGKSAFPIVNTGLVYQDGDRVSAEEIEKLRQLNWGIPINRLLKQLNPELVKTYKLPLPKLEGNREY